jgi:NAD(P)-dependent dehydrogenase (short-subunit alcohol dehydrogenase family)
MSQLLADRAAVVTGGASGLGRAISLTFAEHGANVVVADVRETPREGGEPTHERIRTDTDRTARFVECDVSDPADLDRAVEAADALGGIDVMVNNAGVHSETEFLDVTEEEYDRLMDVNVKGVFFGSQAAGRRFVESGNGGNIINMASLAAVRGGGYQTAYTASKGAVQLLTYALADRFGDDGVRVNCINPGWTETRMLAESGMGEGEAGERFEALVREAIPAGRFGEPSDVANVALFLASDLSAYVNGERIIVDGGFAHT